MAVRLTCVDNASGHDGLRWRMGPDSESVDIVVGETAPGVGELIVNDPIVPEACFSVVSFSGSEEGDVASICAETIEIDDFTNAQPGDLIGGGVYAGIDTIDGTDYHIVAGLAASEEYGLRWKNSRTATSGAGSDTDGLANTLAMEAAGLAVHPAGAYCLAYTGGGHNDWHMPARSQLALMYNNLAGHAEFAANVSSGDYTWASTEDSARNAWYRRFSDGSESFNDKVDADRRVRPVRRVAV